jgi:hypothetical protein
MTKDEIIEDLIKKGIVDKISEAYFITEKYKELLSKTNLVVEIPQEQLKPIKNYDSILNSRTNGKDWPVEVLESKGRNRAAALMNACEVPASSPDGSYRLRGVNLEAVNVIGNLVESNSIDGGTFIEATRLYYKKMEKPKGFKNYILEGDALDVYNDFITGDLQKTLSEKPTDNQAWQ